MGADGKVRIPTQAGGRGRGCGYNFRPQACSRLRRRLGSTRQDRCRRPTENLQWITQIPRRVLKTLLLHLAAPSSLWEAGGGVCLLRACTASLANPWGEAPYVTHPEGQSALTVLLRRQSLRGGSGAVAGPSEGGRSCRRSRLQPLALLGSPGAP